MDKMSFQITVNQQSEAFNATASRRDQEARKYFTSDDFLNKAKAAANDHLVKKGMKWGFFVPDIKALKQDQPYLDQAAQALKKEFPEINHLRFNSEGIVIDTKKNSLLRRITVNPSYGWY